MVKASGRRVDVACLSAMTVRAGVVRRRRFYTARGDKACDNTISYSAGDSESRHGNSRRRGGDEAPATTVRRTIPIADGLPRCGYVFEASSIERVILRMLEIWSRSMQRGRRAARPATWGSQFAARKAFAGCTAVPPSHRLSFGRRSFTAQARERSSGQMAWP